MDIATSETFPSGRYLTLRVARYEFAIDADCVRGILPAHEMTHVEPTVATPWLTGVATFRGQSLPVMDLRVKLNLRHGTYGRNPSIIVVQRGANYIGFIADRVSEIVNARAHDFRGGKLRIGRPRRVLV